MFREKHSNKTYILPAGQVGACLQNGLIRVTEEEIQDRSKGDMVTKGLVVIQTTWFALQLLARAIEHLPVTELEIATLAFAVLNYGTYALWWNKPLNVECPIILDHEYDTRQLRFVDAGPGEDESVQAALSTIGGREGHPKTSLTFFDSAEPPSYGKPSYPFIIVAITFGAIHCIAWSFPFPTATERMLWRIASIITITSPVVVAGWGTIMEAAGFALSKAFRLRRGDNGEPSGAPTLGLSMVYIFARLALLVLAFTSLRCLPPGVYTTVNWTTFIPHI